MRVRQRVRQLVGESARVRVCAYMWESSIN